MGYLRKPPVSALAIKGINETSNELYAGLFNDTANGAAIFKLTLITDVTDNAGKIPSEYRLEQNYPNPFNPNTQIQFALPKPGNVSLKIYNSNGQLVKTLIEGILPEGYHEMQWDAKNNNGTAAASGVYFYRIIVNSTERNFTMVNKMLLLK